MSPTEFASESLALVVRGRFDPTKFSPGWLLVNHLIGEEQTRSAEIQAITPQISIFVAGWLSVQVTEDTFSLSTSDPTEYLRLRDLALGIFGILEDSPVNAIGINRSFHIKIDSIERWHSIGDTVAPKKIWEQAMLLPGTVGLTVRGSRKDEYAGYIQVRFEPSNLINRGIFVERNDHYILKKVDRQPSTREELFGLENLASLEIPPAPGHLKIAAEILRSNWQASLTDSADIVRIFADMGEFREA
ncbi:hypothetical protein [Frankia sp. BMG5.23]|uniref:hypothetical protein n=1 Tax=Frankia sp. BMG5.23 TaxID=683305 RepID=UPI00046167F7|nr:hypothetical protein [Frankia sp. BMG5.23]KDA40827.1 hypothetical protein BMG523Draft_04371 [Frankia sp. BMG5.23]